MKSISTTRFIVATGLAAVLAACATAEQRLRDSGARALTDAELTEVFASRPRIASWKSATASGTVRYLPDGTQHASWNGGSDSGTFSIRDGRICGRWNTIRNGSETCFSVYRVSDNVYDTFFPDGRHNVTATFE